MNLSARVSVYFPNPDANRLLSCTTALAICAHQDDIEMMAYHAIAECFGKAGKWFCGVIVTDGGGSPRTGEYADYTDAQMAALREKEQNKAAMMGDYLAQFHLKYSSRQAKDPGQRSVVEDLEQILLATRPSLVLTHNLSDAHDTHVAVALRAIAALRNIRADYRPEQFFGMEMWRGLDWNGERILFDASARPALATALIAAHDSQISGGKRYDVAIAGRRVANATFFESHAVDTMTAGSFGVDMLRYLDDADPLEDVIAAIDAFRTDVCDRIQRLIG